MIQQRPKRSRRKEMYPIFSSILNLAKHRKLIRKPSWRVQQTDARREYPDENYKYHGKQRQRRFRSCLRWKSFRIRLFLDIIRWDYERIWYWIILIFAGNTNTDHVLKIFYEPRCRSENLNSEKWALFSGTAIQEAFLGERLMTSRNLIWTTVHFL